MKSTTHTQEPVENAVADGRQTVQHAEPMPTFEKRVHAHTSGAPDFVDLTDEVAGAISSSGIRHGRVIVFTGDGSCSVMVNEKETGLLEDLKRTIARLAPNNGSHPVVGSASVVLPVTDGQLQLGTWQRILLVELGEPCSRAIDVQVVGEP